MKIANSLKSNLSKQTEVALYLLDSLVYTIEQQIILKSTMIEHNNWGTILY